VAFDAQGYRTAAGFLRQSIQKRTAACLDRGAAAGKLDLPAASTPANERSQACAAVRGGAAAALAGGAGAVKPPATLTAQVRRPIHVPQRADFATAIARRLPPGPAPRPRAHALPGDRKTHPPESRGVELNARLALHCAFDPVARHGTRCNEAVNARAASGNRPRHTKGHTGGSRQISR